MSTLTTADNYFALAPFLGIGQLHVIKSCLRGEEAGHFRALLATYADRVRTMPQTYDTEKLSTAWDERRARNEVTGPYQPLAYLHYFVGSCDWYITEKDSDPDGEGQIQAFGSANLGYGSEIGYISIAELTKAGAELDLYFTPKPLAECAV